MLLLHAFACAPKGEDAPPTFDELNVAAIASFHDEGAEEAVLGLRDWLFDHAADWEDAGWPGGYTLGKVGEDDLGGVEHSAGTNWDEVLGAGVPLRARGTVDGYADSATEPDQTFVEPESYLRWDRTIVGGTAEGFLAGDDMETENAIEKGGPFGVVIPYDANKDFRWFGDVLAARTWVPEEGWGEDGKNGIVCGFTIEVWAPDGDGVLFYNGSWTQVATVIGDEFPEDVLIDQFIDGTLDYMLGMEAFVMGEYVPPED
jgi:hypothetical protein